MSWWPFRHQVISKRLRRLTDIRCEREIAANVREADIQNALHQIADQRANELRARLAYLGIEVASITIRKEEV